MPKSTLKIILPILLIATAVIIPTVSFGAGFSKCGLSPSTWTACITEGFEWVVIQLGWMLGALSGFLISLASGFMQALIVASGGIMNSPIVLEGFKITLSVANLGFVLAIIIIAFATILRMQNYAAKQLLWKLIVAALLVNFSFALAGVIIDFNNIFGNYFLSAASPEKIETLSNNLANTLDLQKIAGVTPEGGSVNSFVQTFITLVAVVSFNFLAVITIFALAFMLLARYIWLTLLLILMPIAWLLWIFPNLNNLTKKWWSNFIKWNFFFPAVSFFLYLSILSASKIDELIKSGSVNLPSQSAAIVAGLSVGTIVLFIQMLVQIGLILGGLMAANAMGISGASTALGIAGTAKKWATGVAGRIAKSPYTLGKAGVAAAGRPLVKAGAQSLSNVLSRFAPHYAAGTISRLNAFASRKPEVEERQKQYSGFTKEQWDRVKKTMPRDPIDRTALLAEASKRRDIEGLTDGAFSGLSDKQKQTRLAEITKREDVMERIGTLPAGQQAIEAMNIVKEDIIKQYADTAKKINPDLIKEVANVYPQMSEQLTGKSVEETSSKIGGDKAVQLSDAALSNAKVVLNLSEGAISAILKGSKVQAEAVALTIKNAVSQPLQKIVTDIGKTQQALKIAPREQIEPLKADLRRLLEEQRKMLASATESQRKAYSRLQILNQRIGSKTNLE